MGKDFRKYVVFHRKVDVPVCLFVGVSNTGVIVLIGVWHREHPVILVVDLTLPNLPVSLHRLP